jgi:hypothetical protein
LAGALAAPSSAASGFADTLTPYLKETTLTTPASVISGGESQCDHMV